MSATGSSQTAANAMTGIRPSRSGREACAARGADCARAFSTTLVVAGLKAEPVSRLEGGPSGARALSKATPIAVHRNRMKSKRLFMPSFLYGADVMRDMIPSPTEIGKSQGKNQPRKAPLPVDRSESFQ